MNVLFKKMKTVYCPDTASRSDIYSIACFSCA